MTAGNTRQLKEGAGTSCLERDRLLLTVSTCSLRLFTFGSHGTKHLFDAFTIINQHSLMCYDSMA